MRKLVVAGTALTLVLLAVVLWPWPVAGLQWADVGAPRPPKEVIFDFADPPPSTVSDFCAADALIDGDALESHLRDVGDGDRATVHPEFTLRVRRSVGIRRPAVSGIVRVLVLGSLRTFPDGTPFLLHNPLPTLSVGVRYVVPVSWDAELRTFMPTWLVPGGVFQVLAGRVQTPPESAFDFSPFGNTPEGCFAAVERTCREKRDAAATGASRE